MAGRFLSAAVAVLFFLCSGSPAFAKEGDFDREDLLLPDNAVFFDRNGEVLRFAPDDKGQRHIRLAGKDIPDIVKKAFIAAEDKRFYSHNGFDPLAIFRALKDNLLKGRIVSGASTISQQVVKLIYPHERTFKAKLVEISRSARLEETLSKDEILEQYLNRVPLGNNIIGIELASRVYLNKPAADLTAAEAALLASLPKAPGLLNPFGKNKARLLKRKDRVLLEMARAGYLTDGELKEAFNYEIVINRKTSFPNKAPHFVDMLITKGVGGPGEHYTTIDMDLQTEVERILMSHKARLVLKGADQAAVVILHNTSMEVLSSVGSISYSARSEGYNNGTTARRSAGSTIKPFLYAQALEAGFTVSSLLEDTLRKYPTSAGNYSPDNFDRKEYGPVTMRTALGNSLNIAAIKMLEALELDPVYGLLQKVNLADNADIEARQYGLGLVIGNVEVSLEKLVAAYSVFANNGTYSPLRYMLDDEAGAPEEVISRETAYIISDVLSDPSARILTFGGVHDMDFPFRVSLKTGTSTKYRDGWAIGFTPEYTIGVWTGNFDGRPTASITGASGAVPLFKDILQVLYEKARPASVSRPDNVVVEEVCGISGMKTGPHCDYRTKELFIKGTEPVHTCSLHNKENFFHKLPTTYAGWVYDKENREAAGGYRLRGFSKNLAEVFQEGNKPGNGYTDMPGIRIRNGGAQDRRPVNDEAEAIVQGKHYTIGHAGEHAGGHEGPGDLHVADNGTGGRVNIIYPLPNDRFVLDKNRGAQVIRLESITDRPATFVDWFIDGLHYATVGPPYHVYWKLERGRHNISVILPDKSGDYIEVEIE